MAPESEGRAEIQIVPVVTGFEQALRNQLQPILNRVEQQFKPVFAKAGTAAADSFGQAFTQRVQSAIGTAISSAAGARGVADAGRRTAETFGTGLVAETEKQIAKGIGGGIGKGTSSASRAVGDAGVQSGRVFGTGFGEGFAALAAFAIAARVGRFFRDTVNEAVNFETQFAGVRRVVDDSAAGFDRLRTSILEMSERLPFAADAIARTAAESGRLGVQRSNIESFTETMLKFATITGQAPEQAATAFAKFATVTQTSLGESEHLADVVLKLGTAFAANEEEVLSFSRRLTPLAALTKATGEDVLALATGIVQAGGRAESGGTAITQAFNKMAAAAQDGGDEALKFSAIIGTQTVDAFQRLVEADPTEAFVRLLEGIRGEGTRAASTLDELGLGSQRVGVQLTQLAASSDAVRQALTSAEDAAGELKRQFAILEQTPAAQLKELENQLARTRIELGGKLAPALIGILKPIAALSTGTVALIAAFAGLAAGQFAFVRFGNILREFQKTLGAGSLTLAEYNIALQIQAQTGAKVAQIVQVAAKEHLSMAQVLEKVTADDAAFTAQLQRGNAQLLTRRAAFQAARQGLIDFNVAQQIGAAVPGLPSPVSFKPIPPAIPGSIRNVEKAADAARVSISRAAQEAFRATGGFAGLAGSLTKMAGQLGLAIFAIDIVTNKFQSVQESIAGIGRGEKDIERLTLSLIALGAGVGDVDEAIEKARLNTDAFGSIATIVSEELGNFVGKFVASPITASFDLLGGALSELPIPIVRELGSAIESVGEKANELANRIPFLNRIITTEAEHTKRFYSDAAEGLTKVLETAGPRIAELASTALKDVLTIRDGTDAVTVGFADYEEKLKRAQETQDFVAANAETIIGALKRQGATEEELTQVTQLLGLTQEALGNSIGSILPDTEAAAAALQRLNQAQSELTNRVKTLILPVSGLIAAQQKLSKTGGKSARDTLSAARAIADAEKSLREAREDAARRLADARRKLAEAEEDAARRIVDAQRRIDDARFDSTRRLRDATEELQDFERQLAVVGGAKTIEDQIRLRELQQALSDATIDAQRKELEGQQNLTETRREGTEQVEDAQRRLREVIEDNADKIADALEKLSRAHEKATDRQGAAASKAAETIVLSTAQITKGFQDQAAKLNTFSGLLENIFPRLVKAFGSQDFAEAFLADLAEMGVDAIPILKNLVGSSSDQLKGLGTAFKAQIAAAKVAADKQFKRFPPNFKQAIQPAVDNVLIETERLIVGFEALADKGGEMGTAIGADLDELAREFVVLASQAGSSINESIVRMFELAASTNNPTEKVRLLKEAIAAIPTNKRVQFKVDATFSSQVTQLQQLLKDAGSTQLQKNIIAGERNTFSGSFTTKVPALEGLIESARLGLRVFVTNSRAMGGTVTGPLAHAALGATVKHAQFGSTSSAGQALLVGETGRELFFPSTAGAVFKHTDTERILRALRMSGRGVINNIVVNEVAQDALATARAVSFRIGSNGSVR